MRVLRLTEFTTSPAVELAPDQRDALRQALPSMTIAPTPGTSAAYDLTPGLTVGVLRVLDLQIEIAPRLPVDRVLFLVSYALDPRSWRDTPVSAMPDDHLVEAIVPTFVRHVRHALRRGLLHGYRSIEEAQTTIRGRVRFADQLRARPGRGLPVEIAFDDFTDDILENQLLRAATERLLRLPLRHHASRASLRELQGSFATVSSVSYKPGRVPAPIWTRLNERYRPAVDVARLILDSGGLDLVAGPTTGSSVLFNMANVFENFVVAALRETLRASPRTLVQGAVGHPIRLDAEREIKLEPDLSWWPADRCVFVGDCKYKRAKVEGIPNADLYQVLAYATALDLADGVLIYAAGEYPAGVHTVRHADKRLHIVTLDLAGDPKAVLAEIDRLAARLRQLAGAVAA